MCLCAVPPGELLALVTPPSLSNVDTKASLLVWLFRSLTLAPPLFFAGRYRRPSPKQHRIVLYKCISSGHLCYEVPRPLPQYMLFPEPAQITVCQSHLPAETLHRTLTVFCTVVPCRMYPSSHSAHGCFLFAWIPGFLPNHFVLICLHTSLSLATVRIPIVPLDFSRLCTT